MTDRHVVGVFSGGGARAAAHIGVMKACEEHRIVPDRFVATSMGAVIGACFACGMSYDEVLKRISGVSRRDVAVFSPRLVLGPLAPHLLKEGPFRATLETIVPARSFAELDRPLTVTAVDMQSGELVLFGAGGREHVGLIDALYASCALPLYYPPAVIGDREYVDGGLRAVLPLDEAMMFEPDTIVGVHVGPTMTNHPTVTGLFAHGLVGMHRRTVRIMMAIQTERLLERWRHAPPVPLVLVQPRLGGSATFAVEHVVEYVEAGYRAGYRALERSEAGA